MNTNTIDEALAFNVVEFDSNRHVRLETIGGALRLHFQPKAGERGLMTGFAPPPRTVRIERFDPATEHLSQSERLAFTKDSSSLIAAAVNRALDRWGGAVAATANNIRLTAPGRAELNVEATSTAITAVGLSFAKLAQIRATQAAQRATLFAVPKADAAETIVDVECRQLYRALSNAERSDVFTKFEQAHNQRMMLALLRSPIKLNAQEQELLDAAWASQVAAQKPEAAATLVISESLNAWAIGFTQFVGEFLANPSNNGTGGSLSRFAIFKLLKKANAVGLLQFQESELVILERRLNEVPA